MATTSISARWTRASWRWTCKTGDVVWRKKIADYKAGYSYTAAPLIVDGKVITGNSGGEFGIVGAV